jgi:hypothetical protein
VGWQWQWQWTGRIAMLALAFFWVVAGCFLFAAWRSATGEDRMRHAPVCTADEVFTSAMCQATLDGTVVELSYSDVQLDVGSRQLSMPIRIVGQLSGAEGTPVKVTFYRGKPVRVDGPELKADADGSFASDTQDRLIGGLFFLIVGPVLVGGRLLAQALKGPRIAG